VMERMGEPRRGSRLGLPVPFYLLAILTGIFAQGFVSGSPVVDGEAAATKTGISK